MELRWLAIPAVAIASFTGTFEVLRRRARKEGEGWRQMLANDAAVAAPTGSMGVLAGVASDGGGQIAPVVAPFSGRTCLAFHIEVITRERFGGGAETVWRRVFEDSVGQVLVADAYQKPMGRANLQGARVLLPPDLGAVPGVTVYQSSSSALGPGPSAMPPHLVAFASRLALPGATQDAAFASGRNVIFNERIVVPGQPIVVAGHCSVDPGGAGVVVERNAQSDVYVGGGTLAAVRADANRTPLSAMANALQLAGFAAALIGGVVWLIVAATSQ